MNNTPSLEQISKISNLDSNLIMRQYKLDLMAGFMEIKAGDPNLTQKEITRELGYSDSTVSRYRKDIKMQRAYKSSTISKCQKMSDNVTDRQNT